MMGGRYREKAARRDKEAFKERNARKDVA